MSQSIFVKDRPRLACICSRNSVGRRFSSSSVSGSKRVIDQEVVVSACLGTETCSINVVLPVPRGPNKKKLLFIGGLIIRRYMLRECRRFPE